MRHLRLIAVLVLALSAPISLPQKPSSQSQTLWFWFADCVQKRHLKIEVLLDGKAVYESSFAICPATKRSAGLKQKIIVFHFKGGYVFQGEYRTSPLETIEGNIWQAGADPGVVLLGVSFSNKKRILLNTIHIAKPDGESVYEIDRGLKVRTFPLHD
jgi:hypothetical protein